MKLNLVRVLTILGIIIGGSYMYNYIYYNEYMLLSVVIFSILIIIYFLNVFLKGKIFKMLSLGNPIFIFLLICYGMQYL